MAIEVLICASRAIVREGLRAMLTAAPGVSVASVATDPRSGLAAWRTKHSDLLVADLSVRNGEMGEVIRLLREDTAARSPVLAVSHETGAATTNALLEFGACGVIAGDADSTEMVRAIETVASGNIYLTATLVGDLIEWLRARTVSVNHALQLRAQDLTPREREILATLAGGNSLDDTARALFISTSTVRTHVYRIRQKLHLRDRTELVSFAFRAGIANSIHPVSMESNRAMS